MKDIVVLTGTGAIGMAIARRVSVGKMLLLADLNLDNAFKAKKVLQDCEFESETTSVDVSSRDSVGMLVNKAKEMGNISGVIHAAGVPPSNSPPELILKVDLIGTALVLEQFRYAINDGGSCVVVSSQAGHKLPPLTPEQSYDLATTPVDELLDLPLLQADQISDSYHAYQIAKHGCALRVMAESVQWGARNARVNAISPGVIETPLAENELDGSRGAEYRNMIKNCPVGRAGTLDEVAEMGAYLMGANAQFITGSDFLIDGGMSAMHWYGQ